MAGDPERNQFTNLRTIATRYALPPVSNYSPSMRMVPLTLETHVFLEAIIRSDNLPSAMFQQTVFSFRETTRVTSSQIQLSTTTLLLISVSLATRRCSIQHSMQAIPTRCDHQPARLIQHTTKHCRHVCLARSVARVEFSLGGNHKRRKLCLPWSFTRKQLSTLARDFSSFLAVPSARDITVDEFTSCLMASTKHG